MDSLNAVAMVGWLEFDLTTRFTGDSYQMTQCTLRLEEERDGQVHRVYVPVVCYGRTAERAAA